MSAKNPDDGFPAFAVSYYAPSWFGIASGKGSLFSSLAETVPEERLLIPLEFRLVLWRWHSLSLAASLVPALYAENHLPASFNLSLGIGIFYNKFIDGTATISPLSGLYLMFYPLSDIAVITDGRKPAYHWELATDLGYALAITPAPVPLYLGCYLRWIVGWQSSRSLHAMDFGLSVGMLFL